MGKRKWAVMLITLTLAALLLITGCGAGGNTVGKNIKIDDINEFYYTLDGSTNPPYFQRYRFYTEAGKYFFYHEKREGDHWPLTEADITVSGTLELSEEDWNTFYETIRDGSVSSRKKAADTGDGDDGPWLYLYWSKDKGDLQVFEFASFEKQAQFEALCEQYMSAF